MIETTEEERKRRAAVTSRSVRAIRGNWDLDDDEWREWVFNGRLPDRFGETPPGSDTAPGPSDPALEARAMARRAQCNVE